MRWGSAVAALAVVAGCHRDVEIEQPTAAADPLAEAGTGSTYLVGTTVTLDGSGSFDPATAIQSFSWTVYGAPADSTARIVDPSAPVTTMLLDKVGLYELVLTVTDAQARKDTSHVTYAAVGPNITVNAGPDVTMDWKQTVALSGSVQVEASFPATYQWSIVTKPALSVAAIANSTSLNASFVPDAEGTFVIRLTATTAYNSASDDMTIVANIPRELLPYQTVDGAYSTALDRLILVSNNPPQLHIHDPVAKTEVVVPLAFAPLALAMRVDGLRAAVLHDHFISVVDLVSPGVVVVENFQPVTTDTLSGLVYGNDNRIHVFSTNSYAPIYTVDLATSQVTQLCCYQSANFGGMRPDGRTMYAGGSWLNRFDITTSPIAYQWRSFPPPFIYGRLFLNDTGTLIFTQDGSTFQSTDDSTTDMAPLGNLDTGGIASAHYDDAGNLGKLAVAGIYRVASQDVHMLGVYDDQTRAQLELARIPDTPFSGAYYATYASTVGWRSDGSTIYVVGSVYTQSNWVTDVIYGFTP